AFDFGEQTEKTAFVAACADEMEEALDVVTGDGARGPLEPAIREGADQQKFERQHGLFGAPAFQVAREGFQLTGVFGIEVRQPGGVESDCVEAARSRASSPTPTSGERRTVARAMPSRGLAIVCSRAVMSRPSRESRKDWRRPL